MTAKTVCDINNLINLCVICKDEDNNAEINCSNCVATYCLNCLKNWLKQNTTCPYCRQESETFKDILQEVNEGEGEEEEEEDYTIIDYEGQRYYVDNWTSLVYSADPRTIDEDEDTYCVGSYLNGRVYFFRRGQRVEPAQVIQRVEPAQVIEEINNDDEEYDLMIILYAGQRYYVDNLTNLVYTADPRISTDDNNCVGSLVHGVIAYFARR